jgi:hypothetical protein
MAEKQRRLKVLALRRSREQRGGLELQTPPALNNTRMIIF